jgi:oligopeptide/dipeptide ABC transporter ATP-binding protein
MTDNRTDNHDNLVSIRDLRVYFDIKGSILKRTVGVVKAVDGVDLDIRRGEILGLVGESGCGKTTVGRALLRLIEATSGAVYFNGQNIFDLPAAEMKPLRSKMQLVFQDPYTSLDPRSKVGEIVGEGLRVHGVHDRDERRERVRKALELVGLQEYHMQRFPHEFSGGQRQRIGIARALVLNPSFIVCDEPVSALDVSIQSQVLNLLKDLQQELDLTLLFIAHDMSVVEHLCNRVAVMYLGKIVEVAEREELFDNAQHPYTQALMSAIPVADPRAKRERILLEGDVPSPLNPPPGCRFHTRCPEAIDRCSAEEPAMIDLGEKHFCACHLRQPEDVAEQQLASTVTR